MAANTTFNPVGAARLLRTVLGIIAATPGVSVEAAMLPAHQRPGRSAYQLIQDVAVLRLDAVPQQGIAAALVWQTLGKPLTAAAVDIDAAAAAYAR